MANAPPLDLVHSSVASSNPIVTANVLSGFLGKSLEDFCEWYHDYNESHCAHFVSHVLKLRIPHAALCTNVGDHIVYANRRNGYCIRVEQVFNNCANRRRWDEAMSGDTCFVVATINAAIDSSDPLSLNTNPTKHIGILVSGKVFNYSNSLDRVVSKTLQEFHKHYGKNTILLRADLPS